MYITATFTRLDQNADGRILVMLTYTGDQGEPPVEDPYAIDTSVMPSDDYLRRLAIARLSMLNNALAFMATASPLIGTVLDTGKPLPPPVPSLFGAYVAATDPFTPGETPFDVFTITGSALKKVQIVSVALTTVQTTEGMNVWSLVKRSTANRGGTSAVVTAVPTEKTYPEATALVQLYTENPQLGVFVGNVWTGRVAAPAPDSKVETRATVIDGRTLPLTLIGSDDVLAWNFGGADLPRGLSVQAMVWWHES